MLSVHKSLCSHISHHPTPAHLAGYLLHVSTPLPDGSSCHFICVYIPPSNLNLRVAIHQYLSCTITSCPTTDTFVIAGDYNHDFAHCPDPPICQLPGHRLSAVNSATARLFTHFPYNRLHAPSMIDDVLLSTTVFDLARHDGLVIWSPPLTFNSDHIPLFVDLPRTVVPILQAPDPFAEPSARKELLLPIPPSRLQEAQRVIDSNLSPTCDDLLTDMMALSSRTFSVESLPDASLDPHAVRSSLNFMGTDIADLVTRHTSLLSRGYQVMLATCPTHIRHPVTVKSKASFLSRPAQRAVSKALMHRRILTFSSCFIQRCLHHGSPYLSIPCCENPSLTDHLLHAYKTHPKFHQVSPSRVACYPADPRTLLPATPHDNDSVSWKEWLLLCQTRLRDVRSLIREQLKRASLSTTSQRRLARKLSRRPKLAHRQIFADDDPASGTLDQPSHVNTVWDETRHCYYTTPATVQSYTHSYFSKQWSSPAPAHTRAPPWTANQAHALDPFTIAPPTNQLGSLLAYVCRHDIFSKALAGLKYAKAPGPDGHPNELIRIMPASFKKSLRLCFILMWLTAYTPPDRKNSDTILPHKKGPFTHLSCKRPIGLAPNIYKLWTRFITHVLMNYADDHHILSPSQAGFRPGHNPAQHLQRLVHAYTNAATSCKNVYALYLDFTCAFNTISHTRLFAIMHDLGFPPDAINVIKNIYTDVTTSVILNRTTNCRTEPIPVRRGTIQGDALSPLIFIIFLEPLLRWLVVGGRGYLPSDVSSNKPIGNTTSALANMLSALAYADDLVLLTSCHRQLHLQFRKVTLFCAWAGLQLNASKCAVTGALHHYAHIGLASSPTDSQFLRSQLTHRFAIDNDWVPYLPPTQPYKYLGVLITPTLNFKFHFLALSKMLLDKGHQLLVAGVRPLQALQIIRHVLRPRITYCFPIAPFSKSEIYALDKILVNITKHCLNLPRSFPMRAVLNPIHLGGIGMHSLMTDYVQISAQTLTRAMNDDGQLGVITTSSLLPQLQRVGDLPFSHCLATNHLPFSHNLLTRQLSIKYDANIFIHLRHHGIVTLDGNLMWRQLLGPHVTDYTLDRPALARLLCPLWNIGITSLAPILETFNSELYFIPTDDLYRAFHTRVTTRALHAARLALNRLTLLLNCCVPSDEARKYAKVSPLPLDRRKVTHRYDLHTTSPAPLNALDTIALQQCVTSTPSRPPHIHFRVPQIPPTQPDTLPTVADVDDFSLAPPAPIDQHLDPICQQGLWPRSSPLLHTSPTDHLLLDHFTRFSHASVNPDLDIHPPGCFLIQVGLRTHDGSTSCTDSAFVYRPDGTCLGHLSLLRLCALHSRYQQMQSCHPDLFNTHTQGSFAKDVAMLLLRYIPTPAGKLPVNHNWTLTSDLLQAITSSFDISVERFASPLDFNLAVPTYYSLYPPDSLFGATINAYTCVWTGASIAHPPFVTGAMARALRWAAHSASHTSEPTLTLLILPKWTNTLYLHYMQHPNVIIQALDHLPPKYSVLQFPCFLPTALTTPTRQFPLSLVLVANESGIKHFYDGLSFASKYNQAIHTFGLPLRPGLHATTPHESLCHTSARTSKRCKNDRHAFSSTSLNNTPLTPPHGFRVVSTATLHPAIHTPPHPPDVPTLLPLFPLVYDLYWTDKPICYTDGSCLKPDKGPNLLGAAFFDRTTHTAFTVNPNGNGCTNTITRAELAAICAALLFYNSRLELNTSLTIFTDSLASIYLIQKALHYPSALRECKHVLLLRAIATLLLQRTRQHCFTTVCKVKAHAGISGNEIADKYAALALVTPGQCTFRMSHDTNDYYAALPAWPVSASGSAMFDWFDDLTQKINDHVVNSCPYITAGTTHSGYYSNLQDAMIANAEPVVADWLWKSSVSRSWSILKTIYSIRFGTLWTAALAQRICKPYNTAHSFISNGSCPLCGAFLDSSGHILGSCPLLHGCYITRHNKALVMIHDAVMSGSLCNAFIILDATAHSRLPTGVVANRLPTWMLPGTSASQIAIFRPDLLVVQGLTPAIVDSHNMHDPSVLHHFQQSCIIHILELGYTSDASYVTNLSQKHFQHIKLCRALVAAGWSLGSHHSTPYHIILLGMTGHVFKPCLDTLSQLGISRQTAITLMLKLVVHAARSAHSVICMRRRLEWCFDSDSDPP